MSNSIIDQQRDEEDFFWIFNLSRLFPPVKPYDYKREYKELQRQGAQLVYSTDQEIEGLFSEIQKMLEGNYDVRTNPYYWTEPVKASEVTVAVGGGWRIEPHLWQIVDFMGARGIVYKTGRGVDEDGSCASTLGIHGWRKSKYEWQDKLRLFFLKIAVKYFNYWG